MWRCSTWDWASRRMPCGTFNRRRRSSPMRHRRISTSAPRWRRRGRLDESVAAFRTALARRPGYTLAHNNLGQVLLAQGKTGEALKHLEEAVRLDAANPQALFGLAEAYAAVGLVCRGDRRDRPRRSSCRCRKRWRSRSSPGANSTCAASLSWRADDGCAMIFWIIASICSIVGWPGLIRRHLAVAIDHHVGRRGRDAVVASTPRR